MRSGNERHHAGDHLILSTSLLFEECLSPAQMLLGTDISSDSLRALEQSRSADNLSISRNWTIRVSGVKILVSSVDSIFTADLAAVKPPLI